jgi:hypothetical protein
MFAGVLHNVPQVIVSYNVTRTISEMLSSTTTAAANSLSLIEQTTMISKNVTPTTTEFSPAACFGFIILLLATVGGNTLVLLALFLDKRLHSPSFYLIANMAIADLLLGKDKISIFILNN